MKVGNRLAKGSRSAVFVIRDPPSTTAELEFRRFLSTDVEIDKAELGIGSRENPLRAYS